MKKRLFIAIVILIVVSFSMYFYLMFTGPHMISQPHILSFERKMPLPPEGIVTVERDYKKIPSPAVAGTLKNPLSVTKENINQGKVYYGYYCLFCHGVNGNGNGPVGQSYMPRPADLRKSGIREEKDGILLRKMLTGPGHEPVLARVVPPYHRWYLVLYIQTLGTTQ
ncbi:MAG: cytochrome C [Smithella sp.]